jgi:phage terminase large subunit
MKIFSRRTSVDCEKLFVNYWDNPYCPQATIDFLLSLKRLDPKRYLVDGEGEWGVAHEGLIYKDWEAVNEEQMPPVQFYGLDFGFNDPCCLIAESIDDKPGQEKKDLYWNEMLYETRHTSSITDIEIRNDRREERAADDLRQRTSRDDRRSAAGRI